MRRPIFARLVLIATIVGLSVVPLPANAAGGVATDKVVSTHQSSSSTTVVSPAFTTSQSGELLVAFVATDGPAATGSQQFTSVTGGGLTWRLRQRTNVQYGTAEVWQAASSGILTNATVTARTCRFVPGVHHGRHLHRRGHGHRRSGRGRQRSHGSAHRSGLRQPAPVPGSGAWEMTGAGLSPAPSEAVKPKSMSSLPAAVTRSGRNAKPCPAQRRRHRP